MRSNAELCCVLGFAGKPALPALLGRGANLAGPSGYWVGHSSGSFAVELLSDREPGLVPGSRGYTGPVSPSFGRGGTTRVQRFMAPMPAGSRDPRRGWASRAVAPRSFFIASLRAGFWLLLVLLGG